VNLDVALLSRLQFAFTIMFHYLFPPLTIGLGALLVFMEGMYLKTRDPQYEAMARFWTKIFALSFAMGVASGIVMEFQFGTNWANYSRFVGDVFGSALAAEGVFAFFLESGFLAILVFGWDRVSPRVHFFSTIMVSLGSMFSAIWIVVANSWQQTPAGFHIVGHGSAARAEITDFWALVFNPSSMPRLTHTLLGAFILGAFFVMSVTGYYILRGRHLDFAKKCFNIALIFAAVSSVAQLFAGHHHATIVAEKQPEKLAAFEGIFETTTRGAPLHLFGIPDVKQSLIRYAVSVPGGLSLLVHGDASKPIPGLDQVPKSDRPPVMIPFVTYHVMVALGMFFIAVTLIGLLYRWRGTLYAQRWLLWVFVFAVAGAYVANQAGWIAAEVGRQPWSVYRLLRTSQSLSPAVKGQEVLASIIMFGFVYLMLFAVWIYVLNDKIQHGPDPVPEAHGATSARDLIEAAGLLDDAEHSLTSAKNPSQKEAG
jgi:cytochrome bd ubiquinol oxidase subunit I